MVQRSPATYSTGTVYGQIGTQAVVGAGTSWTVPDGSGSTVSNIAALDWFAVDGQPWVPIKSIEDDQHLTLWSPLPFGMPAGTAYTIIKATVSPTSGVQGLLQKILALGTSASPLSYEAFDNGVSAFQIGFADDGRIRLRVGAKGADGSAQNPWHDAFLIDPATGNVTVTGLAGGSGSANRFWYITGKPANSIGVDGDVNFDFVSGFVVYRKNAGTWSAGLDVFAALEAAVTAHAADAQAAATAAQGSAALASGWASTADNTDVPGAPPGSRSAKHYADKASGSASDAAESAAAAGSAAGSAVSGKANKGANSDITSLAGLTTALSVAQGGTGVTSLTALLAALGFADVIQPTVWSMTLPFGDRNLIIQGDCITIFNDSYIMFPNAFPNKLLYLSPCTVVDSNAKQSSVHYYLAQDYIDKGGFEVRGRQVIGNPASVLPFTGGLNFYYLAIGW